jgi:hypothetical protein
MGLHARQVEIDAILGHKGQRYGKVDTRTAMLPMLAGQGVMSLRYDYSIGDGDWYTVNASGDVEARNPLRYAQSLTDQSYSWVSVRPKGIVTLGVSDWNAEMASHEAGDPTIENSGASLKAIEVDYRKTSQDGNTVVVFYRTKANALAAAQATKRQAESDAKAAAEQKAFDAEWGQRLTSLPYMIANRDAGFKVVYAACKPTGKNSKGEDTCKANSSHDWSDSRAAPYQWFTDIEGCEDAAINIRDKPPADVDHDGGFMSDCVPAPKVTGHTLAGYKTMFALTPAVGADNGDYTYANLRERGAKTARVFETFNACYDAWDAAYSKTLKDLGVDEDGNVLSDKTKIINLTATCVRVY